MKGDTCEEVPLSHPDTARAGESELCTWDDIGLSAKGKFDTKKLSKNRETLAKAAAPHCASRV